VALQLWLRFLILPALDIGEALRLPMANDLASQKTEVPPLPVMVLLKNLERVSGREVNDAMAVLRPSAQVTGSRHQPHLALGKPRDLNTPSRGSVAVFCFHLRPNWLQT